MFTGPTCLMEHNKVNFNGIQYFNTAAITASGLLWTLGLVIEKNEHFTAFTNS